VKRKDTCGRRFGAHHRHGEAPELVIAVELDAAALAYQLSLVGAAGHADRPSTTSGDYDVEFAHRLGLEDVRHYQVYLASERVS
jgi:hypothetical protein